MSDLIERQKVIDVLCSDCQGRCIPCESYPCSEVEAINALPSAQPEIEERKEESAQNVPKEDLISRKEAIEAMSESLKRVFPEHRQIAEKCLNVLPPAQQERKKGEVDNICHIHVGRRRM